MRCGQVYDVLQALRRGEEVVFDDAGIKYLQEKGIVKCFSEEQYTGMKAEAEKLPEEEKELEQRLKLRDSCSNQITSLHTQLSKMGLLRRMVYVAEHQAMQKQLEELTEHLPDYKEKAAAQHKTVSFTRELKNDLEGCVKTNKGYVKLTYVGETHFYFLLMANKEFCKDMHYDLIAKEVPSITPQTTL